uniref:Uncharacterized protein n=1 Tax=Rhizophora mucronata TaxID=61149 RepID=A0A2P2PD77_RHIMU
MPKISPLRRPHLANYQMNNRNILT